MFFFIYLFILYNNNIVKILILFRYCCLNNQNFRLIKFLKDIRHFLSFKLKIVFNNKKKLIHYEYLRY